MDPTKEETFALLDNFLGEMAATFPDEFLHLGGDEVPTTCWEGSPHVVAFMKAHGFTANELESYFVNR